MPSFELRGPIAELRWGYYRAATLEGFRISTTPTGLSLTATVVESDAIRVAQPALTFCLRRPTTVWTWPVESLHIADGRVTATLGPQE